MKKTLLIALISGAIFSAANGATNATIQNNTNSTLQVTLESLGKQVTFTVNPGETTGKISSPENSTLTIKTAKRTMTLENPEFEIIQLRPESGF